MLIIEWFWNRLKVNFKCQYAKSEILALKTNQL